MEIAFWISGALAVIAFLIWLFAPGDSASQISSEQSRRQRDAIAAAGKVADLQKEIQRASEQLARTRASVTATTTMSMLKQLHRESHLTGNEWYARLSDSRRTRRHLSGELENLKNSRRQLAAKRDHSVGGTRRSYARQASQLGVGINALYSGIGELDKQIGYCGKSLTQFNKQTAELRDMLDGRFGDGWRNGPGRR